MLNIQTTKRATPQIVKTWAAAVIAAGGGFEPNSMIIASNLAKLLQSKSYYTKIKYFLPMLGMGINAARVPLIDVLGVGAATNTAFVDADFTQATGLQGNGSTKWLDSLILPSQLGSSNSGGLGYIERSFATGGIGPIGCSNNAGTNSFEIGLRDTFRTFRWGDTSNGATQASVPVNGRYYGQRSSATNRILDLTGSQIASDTTNDATAGSSDRTIFVVGANWNAGTQSDNSLCGGAYMTDGTLSVADILDLDSVLASYLVIPTGRT